MIRQTPDFTAPDYYLRSLDSLARFYNSQITVHVGYLVSSFVAIIAILSLTRPWLISLIQLIVRPNLPDVTSPFTSFLTECFFLAIAIAILLYYFFGTRRVCFKFLLGRVLFYEALSEIVWFHMGTNIESRYIEAFMHLSDRAIDMGVSQAVISLFEAWLSVSLWHRKHPKIKLNKNEKLKDKLRENLRKPFFKITHDSICHVTVKYYDEDAPLMHCWNRADLLRLAHRDQLGRDKEKKKYVDDLQA